MVLSNVFQRSSSLLSIRSRARLRPQALNQRCILPPNARQFTVQSGWRHWRFLGVVFCYLGVGELCSLAIESAKSKLAKSKDAVTHISPEAIQHALDEVKKQGLPTNVEGKEELFFQEIALGEELCRDGSRRIGAAISLYKALKVYPSPEQLIVIYGQTVPKPVFDIILAMIFLDPDTYSHKSPGRRPTDLETREAYILQEMERGDSLCRDESKRIGAATSYYNALKVYPSPEDLIAIYNNNKDIPKPVFNIIMRMIALNPDTSHLLLGRRPGRDDGGP